MTTENKSFTDASIKDSWQTAKQVFDHLNSEFRFDMDVAASEENTLCAVYFDEDDDALTRNWHLSNWCNPPYSNIMPWVEKAIEQHRTGSTVVMLVPADTSVKWFKMAYSSCNEVRFISGRLSFINASTQKPVSGNNKGSVLFIWRAHSPRSSHTVTLVERCEFYK